MKFKPWQFRSFAEQRLWAKLNNFWDELYYDFRFVRYPETEVNYNLQTITDNDVLLYDFDYVTLFSGADEEFTDDSEIGVNFWAIRVPDHIEPLDEEHYSLFIFFLFYLFFFFNLFNFTPLTLYAILHLLMYEYNNEDEEFNPEMEDSVITTVYDEDLEFYQYVFDPMEKRIFCEEDFDFLYYQNFQRYDNNSYLIKKIQQNDKLKNKLI